MGKERFNVWRKKGIYDSRGWRRCNVNIGALNETESIQHQLLAERNSKEIKHVPHDIRTLTKRKLTKRIIELLKELMSEMRMDDEVKEYLEGFDATQVEEEGRVTNFTRIRKIL